MSALRRSVLSEVLACPHCFGTLNETVEGSICCENCATDFPIRDGIPHFCEVSRDIVPDQGESYVQNRTVWSSWRKKNYAFFDRELSATPAGSRIIDVGAGPGFFKELFHKHQYFAIDFYPYHGIDMVTDIVQDKLPLHSNIADAVILSNVLEHLSKPESTLQECYRIMKPGAKLFMTVPFLFKIHQAPYDFCRYTHYKIQQLLEERGFEVVCCNKLGSILDLLGSIKYEFSRIAMQHTKHPWLLKQILRLDYHLNNFINKVLLRLDDVMLTEQDYFVGYSCIARKPF
jgi:SAM-dependent methyltransferase